MTALVPLRALLEAVEAHWVARDSDSLLDAHQTWNAVRQALPAARAALSRAEEEVERLRHLIERMFAAEQVDDEGFTTAAWNALYREWREAPSPPSAAPGGVEAMRADASRLVRLEANVVRERHRGAIGAVVYDLLILLAAGIDALPLPPAPAPSPDAEEEAIARDFLSDAWRDSGRSSTGYAMLINERLPALLARLRGGAA